LDEADGLTRRQWNRTFFDRLYVDEGGVQRADRSELLTEDPVSDLGLIEANPERFARGSTFNRVVETAGSTPICGSPPPRSVGIFRSLPTMPCLSTAQGSIYGPSCLADRGAPWRAQL
jgi:hypothetical protein